MRRWHQDYALMAKRVKHWAAWQENLGRYRKRKPLDCGRVRCGVCHPGKFFSDKARDNKKRAAIEFEWEAYGVED